MLFVDTLGGIFTRALTQNQSTLIHNVSSLRRAVGCGGSEANQRRYVIFNAI